MTRRGSFVLMLLGVALAANPASARKLMSCMLSYNLALSGLGQGINVGFAFGAFKIEPR